MSSVLETDGPADPEQVVAEHRDTLETVAEGDDESAAYARRILAAHGTEGEDAR